MKKNKLWITIPINWVIFLIYSFFLDAILPWFPYGDFVEGSSKYHYGPCSFSITISLVLLILGIAYVVKNGFRKNTKKEATIVTVVLVLSFLVQFFFYLSHFSYFYLFGIVMW